MQTLRASEDWLAWFESTRPDATDARLFAMPRAGGTPVVLVDLSQLGQLATLPDLALDGNDLYWTEPLNVNGSWHGRLRRVSLPNGPTQTVIDAGAGSIVEWPTAREKSFAYVITTQAPQPRSRVVFRDPNGHEREILEAPITEPSIGEGYITFKRAERYTAGSLSALLLGSGTLIELGPGDAPVTDGGVVVWYAGTTDQITVADPSMSCVNKLVASAGSETATFPGAGGGRVAWASIDSERVPQIEYHVARLPTTVCRPA